MKSLSFCAVNPIKITVDHVTSSTPLTSHIHQGYEIYVNVSGNVSFMVENNLYPVFHGNAIITKPYEFHNCIYHDNSSHEHFCINFESDGNEELFSQFLNRKSGANNLIILNESKTQKLIDCCANLADNNLSYVESFACFFKILNLLEDGKTTSDNAVKELPKDVILAVEYINKNLTDKITLDKLAEIASVSVNSLERHFYSTLNMTPFTYIQKKRLALSAKLLSSNKSVIDACYESGFTDYPHYIALFKKYYGLTPLKYKKSILK